MPAPARQLSARSEATTRRTYNRPLDPDDSDTRLEKWDATVERSHVEHHRRLWSEAQNRELDDGQEYELSQVRELALDRSALVAGRTLWLGGTPYAFSRAASQFNCAAGPLQSVYDMVDGFWLLLNGCGVGGKPKAGILHGYNGNIPRVDVIPSRNPQNHKGPQENEYINPTKENGYTWTIRVGDSAKAWAKAAGKMFVPPPGKIDRLVLDYSPCRGPGGRLKGYGWICNGYEPLAEAMLATHEYLNDNAWNLLDENTIGDVFNWYGTVLSSRRAAENLTLDAHHPLVGSFASRKKDYFKCIACGSYNTRGPRCLDCGGRTRSHRRQSNNSIVFWEKPSVRHIEELLEANLVGGEPGFVNGLAALLKCPWFEYFNPCVTGDTELTVREHGKTTTRKIGWLVDNDLECEVWNGEEWSFVKPRETGRNQPTLRITLEDGRSVRCTLYHRFPWDINTGDPETGDLGMIEAQNLSVGDSIVDYPMPGSDKPVGLVKIKSIEWAGVASVVYCFTDPKKGRGTFNGIVTGNCFEIMLGSFCNLTSVSIPHFGRNFYRLQQAVALFARANYRQTCVDLNDGILQPRWHQTNAAQRLCGVSLTGIAQSDWLTDYQVRQLRNTAVHAAYSMADELGMPRPKAVTTVKPEGTRSKISGYVGKEIGEGMHRPLGRYIFNWINFAAADPLVEAHAAAGYKTLQNPSDVNNVLVRFPVEYGDTVFQTVAGKEVNLEPAVDQLARYLRWNRLWADHNVSATISFDREEIPALARMIHENWDTGYIATAFMARVDPTKTARDLGHPYLPQEVVTEADYLEATAGLKPVDYDKFHRGIFEIDEQGCVQGVCPIK